MDGFDVRKALPSITGRTIVLHGTNDVFFPVSVAEDLAQRLPNAELRVISGAPHTLPLTHGAEVSRAVDDLLRGLSR
jgi:pimeloyl-ACP methyl ester carboxylesterase